MSGISMATVTCGNAACGTQFQARTADIARGWGKFCSKSCAKVGNASGSAVAKNASRSAPLNETRSRGTCAFCDKPAVNAYPTNFDDGENAEWSHRLRSHVVRYCQDHEFDAEMAVSYDGEF